jgi:hypothetical protein
MGELGRRRVEEDLSWEVSRRALVSFYERVLGLEHASADLALEGTSGV